MYSSVKSGTVDASHSAYEKASSTDDEGVNRLPSLSAELKKLEHFPAIDTRDISKMNISSLNLSERDGKLFFSQELYFASSEKETKALLLLVISPCFDCLQLLIAFRWQMAKNYYRDPRTSPGKQVRRSRWENSLGLRTVV
eukprot:g69758.t1